MPTRILDLPVVSMAMAIRTNEDWLEGLGAYLDGNGQPIPLDGIRFDFQMRSTAAGFSAPLAASTGATVAGMPIAGAVLVAGNVIGLSVPLSAVRRLAPGVYAAELQALADGITRTIALYTVTIEEGVLR